ncbi:MFS transporter [Hydrogenophaga sp.]|uniref:MFS transporter n=1 Tax=Hydrogenophaga sp. TaxID=1904254 RepID=UPI00272F6C21|nr:MFS transporter [Hydrogenophaga sp.]MDP2075955.1 MFS transporter [Hydrogenophaga sp.]MDP3109249.1 MFS transporter [Hydrogenophaga sp.]MDZ4400591.1 MFS transporter [Hydrogenophaga sp.]
MTTPATAAVHKIPFGHKVAFGLGMLANQMFPAALGIFMVVLVQDLGFPAWMWGILFFLPRVFDSVTDPIMGFISDNTRSTWGRRKQYVFVGAIVMGISFIAMWQLQRSDGITYNFIYFLCWSLVFYTGLTLFSIPYVAMGYEMSDDFHERTSIMAVAQWIGQWAWVIAPWFWVVMYDPTWFENADTATRTLSVWVGVICMLLAMVPAIFLPSRSSKDDTHLVPLTWANVGGGMKEILTGFVEAFSSTPFRKLCYSTFLIFNAFNTVAAFSFFIVVYHLFNGSTSAAWIWPTLFGSVGALVTTFAVIPTVAWMSRKVGKKNAFMLSQGISVIGYVLLWFLMVPGKPWMFMFALPFFAFGIGGLFTLMMSMTADVCDLDELATGKRREGIFGAIYWWMVKFGFAIAGLLSGAIMSVVAFTPGAAVQPAGAVDGLRLFYSGVPIFGTLLAMWVMRDYDLDEARATEVHAELERRKRCGAATSSQGSGARPWLEDHGLHLPAMLGSPLAGKTPADISAMYAEQLRAGVYGLCFSAYTEGQGAGDQLTEAQVRRRVALIAPNTRWLRSFACSEGHEMIPRLAREHGLKTMVGAWISADRDRNEREIAGLLTLAEAGLVNIAVVGNEVLLRGELTEAELLAYIQRVRAALPENVPVGCVDAYFQFLERPALTAACDVLLPNCYPFWEGTDINMAAPYLRRMFGLVQAAGGEKRVIVTETGWPGNGQPVAGAVPSAENAMRYFVDVQQWARQEGIKLFYFSSFDEPWKLRQEGELGTQWGLWDKDERPKYIA